MNSKGLKEWISMTPASRRLGVSRKTMMQIAEREGLVIRQLPGVTRVEFLLEDIERIERQSIVVASADRQPATV